MTIPTVGERHEAPRGARALRVRGAVALARVLAALPPRRIVQVLTPLYARALPSTTAQAQAARDAVCAVSVRCAGQGCLQRSIAVVLVCRQDGHVPGWRTGFRPVPFAAHAWVVVDGRPVGEPEGVAAYRVALAVPDASEAAA